MPKRLDEGLLSKIEEAYLKDEVETYNSLAKRFQVGLSSLERIGRQRGWSKRRDQQSSDKLIRQSTIVDESLAKLSSNALAEFDEFTQKRLLKTVQRGLIAFEFVIGQNVDNPRVLASLAGGLTKLVEVHLKLQPLTVGDFVEILIRADIGPDEFLSQLRHEKERLSLSSALKN